MIIENEDNRFCSQTLSKNCGGCVSRDALMYGGPIGDVPPKRTPLEKIVENIVINDRPMTLIMPNQPLKVNWGGRQNQVGIPRFYGRDGYEVPTFSWENMGFREEQKNGTYFELINPSEALETLKRGINNSEYLLPDDVQVITCNGKVNKTEDGHFVYEFIGLSVRPDDEQEGLPHLVSFKANVSALNSEITE